MDKEKIILLIVGAIIGFVVSLAKDWLMEGKKQKEKEKQFKREKLELLFINISNMHASFSGSSDDEWKSAQINMTLRYYFPNINKKFKKYLNVMHDDNKKGERKKVYQEVLDELVSESHSYDVTT